ncbi:MAG: hypothetical protein M3Q42_11915, partial [Pseudomonadota bacterium]|nr:hypothetical protein [Pseudomonadota bacterium]
YPRETLGSFLVPEQLPPWPVFQEQHTKPATAGEVLETAATRFYSLPPTLADRPPPEHRL